MSEKKKHTFKSFKQKTARLFPRFRKVRKLTKITEEPCLDLSCVQSTVQGETTSDPLVHSEREAVANIEEYQELKFADDADSAYLEIGGDKYGHATSDSAYLEIRDDKYGHATSEELNSKCVGDESNDLPFPVTPVSRRYGLGGSKSGSIDSGIDCVLSPTLSSETSKGSPLQETRVKKDAEISSSPTTLLEKQELKLPKAQNCEKNRTCSALTQEDSVKDHQVLDSQISISNSSNREFNYHAASSKARESNETTSKHDNTYEEIMVDELIDNSLKSENTFSKKSLLNYRPVKDSILLHSPHLLVSPVPRLRKFKSAIDLESAKTSPVPWQLQVNENSAFERPKPAHRIVRDKSKEVSELFQVKEKDLKCSETLQYGIKDKSHGLSDHKNLSISNQYINLHCNKRMHTLSGKTLPNDNIYCHESNTVSNKDDVTLHYDVDVSSSSLDDSASSLSSLENIVCGYSSDDSLHLRRVSETENRKYSHGQEDRNRYMLENQDDSSDSSCAGSLHECDEAINVSWHQYMTKPQKSVSKYKDTIGNLCLQSENVCMNKSLQRSHNVSNLQSESLKMASSSAACAADRDNNCKKSQCKSTYHSEKAPSSKHEEKTDECHTIDTKKNCDISRMNCPSKLKHAQPVYHKQQTSLDDAFLENDMKVDRWKRNSRLYSSLHSSFSYFKGRDHKRKILNMHNLSADERGHSKSTKAVQNYYESFPSEHNRSEPFPGAKNHDESFQSEQNNPCLDQFHLSTSSREHLMKCKTYLNHSDSSVHHYEELSHISSSSQHKRCQNRQAFWIEKRVGMEFSPAKHVLHKNKNVSEKDLCQQILNLYVMDDCQSDSTSDLSGQDPVPLAFDHIYEELLPVDHSRSMQQLEGLDDSLLQYGTYVAPRVQQESNVIDSNHEVYTAEAVKRCLQHGIKQGVSKPRPVPTPSGPVKDTAKPVQVSTPSGPVKNTAKPGPVSTPSGPVKDTAKPRHMSTPSGPVEDTIPAKPRPMSTLMPVEYRIPAKPRPLSTPTGPREDFMKDMINWQHPSSMPHDKMFCRDHQKLDGKENLFEEQFDKLTKFHTVRNGRRMVRYLTLEEAQNIITHFPPPKDPSRISWNEKLVEWDYHHHTPRQTPIKTKPILSQKNTSFPNCDDIPSPIVLTKLRRSKSLSRRYKNWPW